MKFPWFGQAAQTPDPSWPQWSQAPTQTPRAGRLEIMALSLMCFLWGWQSGQWLSGLALTAFMALGLGLDSGMVFSRQAARRAGFLCFFIGVGIAFWTFVDKSDFPNGVFWEVIVRLPLIWAPRLLLRAWGRSQEFSLREKGDGAALARLNADAERLGPLASLERLMENGLDAPGASGGRAGFWGAFFLAMATAISGNEISGIYACAAFGVWLAARAIDHAQELVEARRAPASEASVWPRFGLLCSILIFCGFAGVGLQFAERLADRAAWSAANWRNQSEGGWSTSLFRASIGRTGSVDLPGTLLWRVKVSPPQDAGQSFLLRMALFNTTYEGVNWAPLPTKGGPTSPDGALQEKNSILSLPYSAPPEPGQRRTRFEITGSLSRPGAPVPVPEGAFSMGGFTLDQLSASSLGSLSAKERVGFTQYFVDAKPSDNFSAPPGDTDLQVPPMLAQVMDRKAKELNLSIQGAVDAQILHQYFSHYKYTLDMGRGGRTLVDFLTNEHEGYCEYFASATVLLLRQAGVPARLATGFRVHEYDPKEDQWWVRTRDAHAWAIYWDGQTWRSLDTTPAGVTTEGQPSASDQFFDTLARVQYALQTLDLSNWAKAASVSNQQKNWLLGALIALFALGLDTLVERRKRARAIDLRAHSEQEAQSKGFSSQISKASGLAWHRHESLSDFARKAEAQCGLALGEWSHLAQRREAFLFLNAPFSPALTAQLKRARRQALWLSLLRQIHFMARKRARSAE